MSRKTLGSQVAAVALLAVLVWLGVGSVAGQQRPLPYTDYLSLIGRIRGEAINAQSLQGLNCNNQLAQLAQQLSAINQVQMPDGSIMQVDHEAAGLPTQFLNCNPARFVRFLNGICPDTICLTSGVVIPPEPEGQEETAVADLADFSTNNSASLPEELADAQEILPADTIADAPLSPSEAGQPIEGNAPTLPGETPADSGETAGAETAVDEANAETSEETSAENGVNTEEQTASASEESATDSEANTAEDGGQGETAVSSPENDTATPTPVPPIIEPETGNRRWLWLTLTIGIAIALAMLLFILYQRQNKPAPISRQTAKKVEQEVQTGRKLLTQGEYRQAIHKLFNATLHILEDRGMIRFEQTRTNYELVSAASTFPTLVPHLIPVVDAYDRVWYGSEPLQPAEFESLIDQIEKLKTIQRT